MPIAYAERKKRRQELLNQLAPELRDRLALRHVETVVKLPQAAQQTLAGALTAGLRNIPEAITTLNERPQLSVEEVLRACKNGRLGEALTPAPGTDLPWSPTDPDPDMLDELADLLQECFPGMPGMTARALAADVLLSDVLLLTRARQACFHSKSIQSELVFVALCGLVLRFAEDLNQLMDSRPHYRGALEQSGIFVKWSANFVRT